MMPMTSEKLEKLCESMNGKKGDCMMMCRQMCEQMHNDYPMMNCMMIMSDYVHNLKTEDTLCRASCELVDDKVGMCRFEACVFGEGAMNMEWMKGMPEHFCMGCVCCKKEGMMIVFMKPQNADMFKMMSMKDMMARRDM